MRKGLEKINGFRGSFTAVFKSYGSKKLYRGGRITTLLFNDIKDKSGKVVTEHLWFITNKSFEKYKFVDGDTVQFDARVKTYTKGYKGNREDLDRHSPISTDYKLSHPTKVVKVTGSIYQSDSDLQQQILNLRT
jgi:hypothetical protein